VREPVTVTEWVRWPITVDGDIVTARQHGRRVAEQLGFSSSDQVQIATAISEVALNIVQYARPGEVAFHVISQGRRRGLLIVAHDDGPGIRDLALAMEDGYSTSRSLGMGLPGVRRLMDEFDIVPELGKGTTVTLTKWAPLERRARDWLGGS
jgi:serine/threonine-protein kinase RsbT